MRELLSQRELSGRLHGGSEGAITISSIYKVYMIKSKNNVGML